MKKSTRNIATVIGGAAVIGAMWGGIAWGQSVFQRYPAPVIQEESTVTPTITPSPTPTVTPTVEPVVVEPVAPPVEVAPVEEEPYYGEPIPWIADPNPNNAEGGYWDTTQCPSNVGYQAPDGNQYCAP